MCWLRWNGRDADDDRTGSWNASHSLAAREEGRLFGRTNLAEYIALPDTPGHRRLLERAASSFGRCEDSLLVIGEASVELAETLQLPTIPLMPKGRLPVDDPLARQVLASLVDAVMPAARSKGQPCWMTIPGAIFEESESPERIFFSQLVRLKGFEPLVVSSGRSVILAELGANGFTGLGFDFGRSDAGQSGIPRRRDRLQRAEQGRSLDRHASGRQRRQCAL